MAQFDLGAYKPNDTLNAGQIIRIANRMLFNINHNIVFHNERTAFLALKVAQAHPMNSRCTISNLVVLALFHTLGFSDRIFFTTKAPLAANLSFFLTTNESKANICFRITIWNL